MTEPVPPQIDEPIVRLVHSDIGLPELFARTAAQNQMSVTMVGVEQLLPRLVEFLRKHNVKTIALPASDFLQRLGVGPSLRDAGFDARTWDAITLDQLYEIDCSITDVWAAVAEVGALVIRSSPQHGRAISLVPPIHVAVLEPKNFVADLLDLFDKASAERPGQMVIISGPSKTADIEMTLVRGVHGPGIVHAMILQ